MIRNNVRGVPTAEECHVRFDNHMRINKAEPKDDTDYSPAVEHCSLADRFMKLCMGNTESNWPSSYALNEKGRTTLFKTQIDSSCHSIPYESELSKKNKNVYACPVDS